MEYERRGRPRRSLSCPLVKRPTKTKALLATGAAAAMLILPACGSSKPAVCEKEDALSNSVSKLGNSISSGNIGEIQSAGQQVQSDANALVASAENTYPGQTQEVQSSVESLINDINSFSKSSDQVSAGVALLGSLTQVKNAFEGLKSKYQSSCG